MKKSLTALTSAFILTSSLGFATATPLQEQKSIPPTTSSQENHSAREAFNAAAPYTDIDQLKNGEIVHLTTGVKVTKDQMLDAIDGARVIYVSELHDNIAAHEAQLAVIKDLYRKHPGKIAVGMEMFRSSVQPQLNRLEKGTMPLQDFNELFDRQWASQWREAYQPVLDYIHDKSIPVIGLKPSKKTESLVRNGQMTGPDIPELDLNDPYHRAHYMPFFGRHYSPKMAEKIAEKMYRMMVLWDEAMADNVAKFLSNPENDDKKLVVIAGIGHIGYGFGIPRRAFRRVPHAYSIITPEIGNQLDDSLPIRLGDYVWKVPYDKLKEKPSPVINRRTLKNTN